MRGDLGASFVKGGRIVERRAEPDRLFHASGGGTITVNGRSLLFVRNVGHLMRNPLMRVEGAEVFEGLADAVLTSLIALHDVRGGRANSAAGSISIVKPKMHGRSSKAGTSPLATPSRCSTRTG